MNRLRRTLIVVGLAAALLAPGIARVGARQSHPPVRELVHVVQAGDTLWGIARKVAPKSDVRAVVDRLITQNNLRGGALRPGQPLFLTPR